MEKIRIRILGRRPLKVGSGHATIQVQVINDAESPSPQGRVKLSCGLSVES